MKGKTLADSILFHLKSLNLSLEKRLIKALMERVLCPEKEKTFVKKSCPLAVYVHCLSHESNLVLVKSCAIPEIHSNTILGRILLVFLNQAAAEMHDLQLRLKASAIESTIIGDCSNHVKLAEKRKIQRCL